MTGGTARSLLAVGFSSSLKLTARFPATPSPTLRAWWPLGLHPGFIVYWLRDLRKVISLSVPPPPRLYRGVVTLPLLPLRTVCVRVCNKAVPGMTSPLSLLVLRWSEAVSRTSGSRTLSSYYTLTLFVDKPKPERVGAPPAGALVMSISPAVRLRAAGPPGDSSLDFTPGLHGQLPRPPTFNVE